MIYTILILILLLTCKIPIPRENNYNNDSDKRCIKTMIKIKEDSNSVINNY